MSWKQSIRVIADFGTTASGFTYSHISNDELYTNDKWPGEIGQLKTCTVLQYDEKYEKVESWGHSALAKRYNRKRERNVNQRPVELFKLHLGENLLKKPALKVDYKKAITDYLTEIGKLMQEKITSRWPNVNYKKDVLHIVTVPAVIGFISVPSNPVAAVVKGACLYGISMVTSEEDKLEGLKFVVKSRRLKYTYGIKVFYEWKKGDPIERKDSSNSISKFYKLAERNTEVKIDQEFSMTFYPRHATQTYISFLIFTTTQHNIEYCDDPSAKLLGKLNISLPYDNLGKDRPVSFSLRFAAMEIIAKAKNLTNSQNYSTTFELNFD
nr:13162_t:CDS:2 [Entrophospora candida]